MNGENLNATDPEEVAEVQPLDQDDYLSDVTYQSSDEYDYDPHDTNDHEDVDGEQDPILSLFGAPRYVNEQSSFLHSGDDSTHAYIPTWKRVYLAPQQEVFVSSQGTLKMYQNADTTQGWSYPGSPYKIFTTGNNAFYVHDIVYRAFRGEPPPGWEVRHKTRNYTNNALSNLDIYPKLVITTPVFGV